GPVPALPFPFPLMSNGPAAQAAEFSIQRSIVIFGSDRALARTAHAGNEPVISIDPLRGRPVSRTRSRIRTVARMTYMSRLRRYRSDAVQSPLETSPREINETALLTADEEKALARRIGVGDTEARDQMVRANLRLVV